MPTDMRRIEWSPDHHIEQRIENLYAREVAKRRMFKEGYLNVGWWIEGVTEYVDAAETLIGGTATYMGVSEDSIVLDAGCGMGAQDTFLHQQTGCEITACDATYDHVLATEKRIEEKGLAKYITVSHETATELPYEAETFTHVIAIESAQHFNTRRKFFQEAARVLQPNGKIGLADFVLKREPDHPFETDVLNLGCRLWVVPEENLYTSTIYSRELQEAGFTNVSFQSIGDNSIPFYHRSRKNMARELKEIRGVCNYFKGRILDFGMSYLHKKGVIDYHIIVAEKA